MARKPALERRPNRTQKEVRHVFEPLTLLGLLDARDGRAVLTSGYLEDASVVHDFRRKVWHVVISNQSVLPEVIKGRLGDHEAFVSRANHHFAAQDKVKGVTLDTSCVENRVENTGAIGRLRFEQFLLLVNFLALIGDRAVLLQLEIDRCEVCCPSRILLVAD